MVNRLHWTDMGVCRDAAPDSRPLYVLASDYDAAQALIRELEAVIREAYEETCEICHDCNGCGNAHDILGRALGSHSSDPAQPAANRGDERG